MYSEFLIRGISILSIGFIKKWTLSAAILLFSVNFISLCIVVIYIYIINFKSRPLLERSIGCLTNMHLQQFYVKNIPDTDNSYCDWLIGWLKYVRDIIIGQAFRALRWYVTYQTGLMVEVIKRWLKGLNQWIARRTPLWKLLFSMHPNVVIT